MQFSIIALILSAAVAVSASPTPVTSGENLGPHELAKRTCGTLTGIKLRICQEACKATCTIGTLGFARKLCEKACEAGPLKARHVEGEEEELTAVEDLDARNLRHKFCHATCDVICNSTILALDQLYCLKKCKARC
ncbi:uncharacterized protein EKO05_0004587 [Ascochyta rabiei]|uniref:Uncharacterized protein n=1 Tax=Didymella rabiei TaxID=5454 RepID=A0A163CWB8_DIDRA|nr:uncharacterized protein EKO05_0004587 [Ascochyta rabiei]KZM22738.1 hypothetical protein ST47_g6114 [Ascochyta rabiei]UPX14096.1 hypothetical protein EKO05_0004587 [Ascochyta rabiei]